MPRSRQFTYPSSLQSNPPMKFQPGKLISLSLLLVVALAAPRSGQAQRRGLTNRDLDNVRIVRESRAGAAAGAEAPQTQTSRGEGAQQQEQQPTGSHAGSCVFKKPVDPEYFRTAEESGGQLYMLDPSEMEHVVELSNLGLQGLTETVFRAGGALDDDAREFVVGLDAGVERIAFVVFVECKDSVKIISPSGREAADEAYLADQRLRAGRFLTVNTPLTGVWRVRVEGSGKFSVAVLAKSQLALRSLQFVESQGGAAEESASSGKSLRAAAGAAQNVRAWLSGRAGAAQLKLMAADGTTIQSVALEKVSGGEENDGAEFVGVFKVPAQQFRVAVEGLDGRGLHFQRTHPPLLRRAKN